MGKDIPQKLLLLRANGAALGLPDYGEMEKPKKAGHNEPVEEEEEEVDESDEDEGEEAEEKEARGELAGAEEESLGMGQDDSQKCLAITHRKSEGPQIARGPVGTGRAQLENAWERDAQSDEGYEAKQQEKRAMLLRGSAAPASVSATGARASTDIPPRPSCLGGR